jgi:hypothetical protein
MPWFNSMREFGIIAQIILHRIFDFVINSIVRSLDKRQMTKLGLNEAEWNLPWRERREIVLLRARQKRNMQDAL